jgi:hypothetical protein
VFIAASCRVPKELLPWTYSRIVRYTIAAMKDHLGSFGQPLRYFRLNGIAMSHLHIARARQTAPPGASKRKPILIDLVPSCSSHLFRYGNDTLRLTALFSQSGMKGANTKAVLVSAEELLEI